VIRGARTVHVLEIGLHGRRPAQAGLDEQIDDRVGAPRPVALALRPLGGVPVPVPVARAAALAGQQVRGIEQAPARGQPQGPVDLG
jgi:hypothetical protein